jgi:sugar lactone lactonase YvrE
VGYAVSPEVVISTAPLTPVMTTAPTLSNLMPNHILWDPGTARLYASVPSAAGSWGNSVAVINPATQLIESTIFAGSEPNALAVSSDSQYLYVGVDGAGSIARINLTSHALESQYFLGNQPRQGPVRAQQIAVVPGAPHTYVAILRYKSNPSPNDGGTAVYDDGVQRPTATGGNDEMVFSDSPSVLYGYDYQLSGNAQIMTIDSSGISITKTVTRPVIGVPTRLYYDSGILYVSTGRALIPATPALAGTFNVGSPRDMAVDGPGGSAYFLADNSTTRKATLLQYDLGKYVLKAYQDLSAPLGSGSEIAKCGTSGFAVLIYPGIVFANGGFTAIPPLGSSASNLTVNRLLWNSARGQIIASIPGFAGPSGNSIALIDPNSQTITSSFFVGSEPDPMALSSDGNTLFVALDGSGTVAQLDLQSESVMYTASLGIDSLIGPLFAQYLSANPVDPNEVAVSRSAGVVILDRGSELPKISDSPFNSINSIAFGNSGANLYGYNNANTGFDFYQMSANASGVSLVGDHGGLLHGFSVDIQNHDGSIYSTNGTVVNPAVPALLGSFPNTNGSASAFLDDSTNEAYFLQYDPTKSPATTILRYNLKNYSFIDSTPVGASQSQGRDLIRYGANGVAFASSSGLTFATVSTATPLTPDLAHLTVRHLLSDAARGKIYATVPGSVPGIGNSVAIIDPASATIASTVPVGSEPDAMALSTDGAYLYVGLDGAGSVARVNLATNAVDQTFSVGADSSFGAETAQSISVSPTNSSLIAVAHASDVAIFSNGAMLPNTTQPGEGSATVAFCDSGSTLYGYDSQATGFGFYTMSVDSSGVQQIGDVSGLIGGIANIICDTNVIYASTGYAVDPLTNTQLGVFSGLMVEAGMAVDDANKKVFFLNTTPSTNAVSIEGFSQTSYSRTGTLPVTSATSPGRDLVRWGSNGFAVATQNQVLVLTGTLP